MKNAFLAGILILFAIPSFAQTASFVITEYGAVPDGKTIATRAL